MFITVVGGGGGTPEGTVVLSTGETGAVKFLREDGDNSSSWQEIPGKTGYIGQNLQTGATYELVLGDAGKIVEMNNATKSKIIKPNEK